MAYFVRHERAWQDMTQNPNGMIGSYFHDRGRLLENLAKRQVGVRTGDLRRAIHSTISTQSYGFLVRVGAENPIAYLHHEGTKPHYIFPKTAKTLRFNHRGKIVYAKVVRHPGTKPNRYLSDNLSKVI